MWPGRVCEIVVTEVAPAGLAPNAMGGHRRIVQQHLLEHYSCCQGGGASLWIASARDVHENGLPMYRDAHNTQTCYAPVTDLLRYSTIG